MIPLGGLYRCAAQRHVARDRSSLLRIKWSLLRDRALGPKSLLHGARPPSATRTPR